MDNVSGIKIGFVRLVFGVALLAQTAFAQMGSIDIFVREVADCEDRGTDEFRVVGNKIRKVNRTTYLYTGVLETQREINKDYKIKVMVGFYGNGGWKMSNTAFDLGQACTFIKTYSPQLLKTAFGDQSRAPSLHCPTAPGNYTIADMNTKLKVNIPWVPSGTFRMDFIIYNGKTGEKLGCKRFTIEIPRKTNTRIKMLTG